MTNKLQRPESLSDVIVREIQNRIIEGTLSLGEAISENALAKELGVSKTPVRDAIQRLHAERLLDILPNRGTVVFSLEAAEVEQLSAYRLILETAAARAAMAHDAAGFATALGRVVEQMHSARARNDLTTYRHLDADFHACIFASSGNIYLEAGYRNVRVQIQALRTRLSIDPKHIEDSYQEHLRMLELAKSGQTEEFISLITFHITNTMRSFKAVLDGHGAEILRMPRK